MSFLASSAGRHRIMASKKGWLVVWLFPATRWLLVLVVQTDVIVKSHRPQRWSESPIIRHYLDSKERQNGFPMARDCRKEELKDEKEGVGGSFLLELFISLSVFFTWHPLLWKRANFPTATQQTMVSVFQSFSHENYANYSLYRINRINAVEAETGQRQRQNQRQRYRCRDRP